MSADGTWNTTINTPMGAQQGTLTLSTDGGELTGKMASPQGELELQDGNIDGDNLTYPQPRRKNCKTLISGF